MGDKIVHTLWHLFQKHDFQNITIDGGIIEIQGVQESDVIKTFKKLITEEKTTNTELAKSVKQEAKYLEKYDYLLPEPLFNIGYGAKVFDVDGALKWITDLECLSTILRPSIND